MVDNRLKRKHPTKTGLTHHRKILNGEGGGGSALAGYLNYWTEGCYRPVLTGSTERGGEATKPEAPIGAGKVSVKNARRDGGRDNEKE